MGSQHIQMLRVALFAALTIVAFGDHGMTTTAAAEPDTTTTVAATTTTTAPIAGERRAEPITAFKCKECDDWMACDGNHFLAVTKLDGTNGDCARTTGILNPLLSAAGTACHGYRGYEAQTFRRRGYIVNVGYAEVADNCDATADAINQKIAGAAVVAKVACTASGYIGNMLFVPGDITACKPVACALNDVVGAFDPDCPVPTAAPAFTQITQTVVQTVPGVDARRAAMNVQYISVVSDTSGVDTTTASNGVTDTSAFATAVATVIASDTTTYSSVTTPSASDITSVSTPRSVLISNAPQQTTCRDLKIVYQNHTCCGQNITKAATFTNTPTTCRAVRDSYKSSECCSADEAKNATMIFNVFG